MTEGTWSNRRHRTGNLNLGQGSAPESFLPNALYSFNYSGCSTSLYQTIVGSTDNGIAIVPGVESLIVRRHNKALKGMTSTKRILTNTVYTSRNENALQTCTAIERHLANALQRLGQSQHIALWWSLHRAFAYIYIQATESYYSFL